ncbi:MAG TPA: diaminopimelate epimerase [Nocardioides sp.]|nr:diaminopimelate epimerase [Nocardioides sp.]
MSYAFLKGHGTENDFVLVPADVELTPARVRALCDRRAGIGGDGVIRAVREDGRWFMDYLNSDGSPSEMCGNGIRVYARYLHDHEGEPFPMEIGTRDGVKVLTEEDGGLVTVDLGKPRVVGETTVAVGGRSWPATHVDMGNPHAVAFVDDLADAGPLLEAPEHDAATYPDGVNVEFVVRRGEGHVGMRVHERGSGETRSCGTGACAVMVASAVADGRGPGSAYRVDVPGGTLTVTWTADDRVLLTGPAVIVARGTTDL